MEENEEKNSISRAALAVSHMKALGRERELAEREKELEANSQRLREEQLARERQLQSEIESREAIFSKREALLIERQREFERQLISRQSEIEALKAHLTEQVSVRESKLQQTLAELKSEKERYNEESRKRIERTSKSYVEDALKSLEKNEISFHSMSKVWSSIGALSLIVGAGVFVYVTVASAATLPEGVTWEVIVFAALKGVISVGLLGGVARYAFLLGNAYMRESLKNADRRHAINFGKFYLESYGAAADWAQIKEAFEHWNIAANNAFSEKEEKTSEAIGLDKAADLIERIAKVWPTTKGGGA